MVQQAASIAQVASTAFPPFMNVMAPALAASGLPVTATHWVPCSMGLLVRWANVSDPAATGNESVRKTNTREWYSKDRMANDEKVIGRGRDFRRVRRSVGPERKPVKLSAFRGTSPRPFHPTVPQ